MSQGGSVRHDAQAHSHSTGGGSIMGTTPDTAAVPGVARMDTSTAGSAVARVPAPAPATCCFNPSYTTMSPDTNTLSPLSTHMLLTPGSAPGSARGKRRYGATQNGDISLVSLASMEEFSDLGTSTHTEDSFTDVVAGGGATGDGLMDEQYHADQGETSSDSDMLTEIHHTAHNSPVQPRKHKQSKSSPLAAHARKSRTLPHPVTGNGSPPVISNGPLSPTQRNTEDTIISDLNDNKAKPGGVLGRVHSWLEQRIESTEDLERIFVTNGYSHADALPPGLAEDYKENRFPLHEFAERYFNTHYISTSGPSSALSKTVNFVTRRPNQEVVPVEQLLRSTKNSTMPTSLIRLLNPRNTQLACSIFKDICKYVRHADLRPEYGFLLLRGLIEQGIDHVELRDEIYCQAMRQCTGGGEEWTRRAWHVLALCTVAFQPCTTLKKYVLSFVYSHCENQSSVSKFAKFSVKNLTRSCSKPRCMPPSFPEVQAVINLSDMELAVHLLDGQVLAVHVGLRAQVSDVLEAVRHQMGLQSTSGWSLYESTPEYDRHVHDVCYVADVLSKWEQKRCDSFKQKLRNLLSRKERKQLEAKLGLIGKGSPKKGSPKKGSPKKSSPKKSSPKKSSPIKTSPKKGSHGLSPTLSPLKDFGKLVFCKRIFERLHEAPLEAVDIHLLYSQAVHYTVQLDEYNVSLAAALQLAGLQAQVDHGDFLPDTLHRYAHPRDYICERLLSTHARTWSEDIAAAHKKHGAEKSESEAEQRYLAVVAQYPLYGCTKIFAHYRGIWQYGAQTVLALDADGIKFISIQEKYISFNFYYSEIEAIILEEVRNEFYITLQLSCHVTASQQKCFLFECLDLEDFAKCIEFHSPRHATWLGEGTRTWRHRKFQAPEDWLHLSDSLSACRLNLIRKGIVRAPAKTGSGIIRTALSRLSRQPCRTNTRRMHRHVSDSALQDEGESSEGRDEEQALLDDSQAFSSVWTFTKTPFKASLLAPSNHEMEDVAARMFNSTLVYAGLETSDMLQAMDLVIVVQALIIKCIEKDELCNELYLQLIKQTSDTLLECNERAVVRYWHLMTMATCVMFPPNPAIFHYLSLHLKRHAMESKTETGQYALFCIKNLYRTQENGGRQFPPSFKEIDFVTKRQAIEARVSVPDGHQMLIEFDSASTAKEVLQLIKAKSGMRLDAQGFALYLVLGNSENCIAPEEHVADSLHLWESWAKTSGSKDLKFLCKKRLFLEPPANYQDPVEVDLVYHQSVTDLFEQKIPLTKRDAVQLCALRAQTEFGDYGHANSYDYSSVMRILPRHLRELISVDDIPVLHKSLAGTPPSHANIRFMHILRHWPLYGATMFNVTQSGMDSLPGRLWLAVSILGVHLMEYRGQTIFFTYTFEEIADTSPCSRGLTFVIGDNETSPSVLFVTKDAVQIHQLIADYRNARAQQERRSPRKSPKTASKYHSRSPKSKAKSSKNKAHARTLISAADHGSIEVLTHGSTDRLTHGSTDRLTHGSSGRLADASGDATGDQSSTSASQGLSHASTSYLADSMHAVFSDHV